MVVREKLANGNSAAQLVLSYKGSQMGGERKLRRLAVAHVGIVPELEYGDDAAIGLKNRVRANLQCLEKGGRVLKEGSEPGAVWELAA